jgi:hypothetical protein
MDEIRSGKWCMFEILNQDGTLSKKVCQVTTDLIRLVDRCYDENGMRVLAGALPPNVDDGKRLPTKRIPTLVGGELHKLLYTMAVKARRAGRLASKLKITRPANMKRDDNYLAKGEESTEGPDFVLSGIFDGEQVHAAWDFTSARAMAEHYNRDVLGKRRARKSDTNEPLRDREIHGLPDTVRYWSSYIVLFY